MRTKRQLAAVAILTLAGCTWGRGKPENCARFALSSGNVRLEQLAAEAGVARVTVEHSLCSNQQEALNGFPRVRHEEVGWCARIDEQIPGSATAAAASVSRWCATAVQRRVRYAHWASVIGDRLLFVGERDVIEPPPTPRR